MPDRPLDSPIEERRPLREEVYARLKQAIIDGQLPPGEHLVETKLAERFGVSRVPVREAILSLEREHLVTASSQGMVVSSFTRKSIEEAYAIRALLEAHGCQLAAQRITLEDKDRLREILDQSGEALAANDLALLTACDIELHDVLINASGSATLKNLLDQLPDSMRRFRIASLTFHRHPEQVLADHRRIVNAVIGGKAKRAETLMHDHILRAAQRLLASLQDNIE